MVDKDYLIKNGWKELSCLSDHYTKSGVKGYVVIDVNNVYILEAPLFPPWARVTSIEGFERDLSYLQEEAMPLNDSEKITEFLKDCTDMDGRAIIQKDEMADFSEGKITIKKTHS